VDDLSVSPLSSAGIVYSHCKPHLLHNEHDGRSLCEALITYASYNVLRELTSHRFLRCLQLLQACFLFDTPAGAVRVCTEFTAIAAMPDADIGISHRPCKIRDFGLAPGD
jgi:hypothetical protein